MKNNGGKTMKNTINLMIIIGAVAVTAVFAQQATIHPTTFTAQGVLRDAQGRSLEDDTYEMTFQIYGNESGTGTALWSETADVEVTNGVWTYTFGSATGNPLDDLDDDGTNYLKITVGTDVLSPLTAISLSPFETLNVSGGGNLFSATGNVGIGTTSPSKKLDVVGDIKGSAVSATGDVTAGDDFHGKELHLTGHNIWFENDMRIHGNENHRFYFESNHSTNVDIILRDKEDLAYGYVYGSGNGSEFGLLDGDGNWSYRAKKDDFTEFRINNSAKMRITSAGNVGIGTNSPSYKLDVQGDAVNARLGRAEIGGWPANTNYAYFGNRNLNHASAGNYALIQNTDGTTYLNAANGKDIYFRDNNSTNMFIKGSNGNVGIRTTSVGGGDLVIGGFNGSSSHNAGNAAIQFKGTYTSGEISFQDQDGDPDICFGYNGSSYVSYINHDGSYAESSDRRLKENIEPLANVLSKVMQLSPKYYKYKESAVGGNRQTKVGFIAQDVQEHFPSIVDDDKEFLGLSYSKFGVLSIKAVQELKNEKDVEIESLNNQLAALTELVNDLQDQLNASQR